MLIDAYEINFIQVYVLIMHWFCFKYCIISVKKVTIAIKVAPYSYHGHFAITYEFSLCFYY